MEAWLIALIWIMTIILFSIIGGEIRFRHLKKHEKRNIKPKKKDKEGAEIIQIIHGSGAFRQSKNCKHPNEYLCVKCGDCGRIFVK